MLEKSSDQVLIGFSFDSDWLRKWCEFPGPIMGFTSFRYVIGLENSHHDSLNQSAANLETIETWSLPFSQASLYFARKSNLVLDQHSRENLGQISTSTYHTCELKQSF